MTLSPSLRETLQMAGEVMREAEDDWWIIASAAAALHGVDPGEVADVDVLTSDRDARSTLRRLGVAPLATSAHPLFRSRVLGRWTSPPMIVEVMAGFHVRTATGWREIRPATRERVDLDGVPLFTPSRTELAEILTSIGRPKDLERARSLAEQPPS